MPSHVFLANPQLTEDIDPPPPYPQEDDHIAPNPGEGKALIAIPDGRWDLACNIDVQGGLLQLSAEGKPTWTQDARAATFGDRGYRRDGFTITPSPSEVVVTDRAYAWACDAKTDAGQLLMLNRDTISLKNLGGCLVVFERTIVKKDRDRPPPKPRDDRKACLKIESQSPNIWTITGTDIYQVEGYENDIVVRSPNFLRLWDMAKGRFRWEKADSGSWPIWGFTKKYIVIEVGDCHLYERKSGNVYGTFRLPLYNAFIDFNKDNHFGPVMSTGGLFLYKPCRKAIFIFQIRDREVDFRIYESTDDIHGSLVLRGDLENFELRLVGQKPTWTKYEETVPVYKNGPIKKRLL
ncbi:uncharacterized protein PFLUO_LOCUS5856 [Penicillium psychrofluorescens]|uniref:uncharacterized protein n=1 Tax=Penicillium psychrofluorescens TaxID=3158075 RepID=UPI003CCD3B9B